MSSQNDPPAEQTLIIKEISDYERKELDGFLRAIAPNIAAYKNATFSYLALKHEGVFQLIQGRLVLRGFAKTSPTRNFQSENIKAGVMQLEDLNLTLNGMIETLFRGVLKTPEGELRFPPQHGRAHSVHFSAFHFNGIPSQHRQMNLYIRGDRSPSQKELKLDWELKSASTPFVSVQDLCDEYSINQSSGDSTTNVEIIALNVAEVAVAESSISGTKAHLAIHFAHGLNRKKCSVGYRVIDKNMVIKRGCISSVDLLWRSTDEFQCAEGQLELPVGAIVHCIANYDDQAQHHEWISDPRTAQNPLRSIHQSFDTNLRTLEQLIDPKRGSEVRNLEVAVSWLLWMLGFSVTHIGGVPKSCEAPDLIASTDQGKFLVIECTTGILKEESKLPHVIERAATVRQSLTSCGQQQPRVLPVIITTKTREEIAAELDQAHKHGVLVLTREDFSKLIKKTMHFPDPNQLYAEAEQKMQRLKNPPPFPGFL